LSSFFFSLATILVCCSLGGFADNLHVVLVLLMHLDGTVRDGWWSLQELVLQSLVLFGQRNSLVVRESEYLSLLLLGQSLELLETSHHLCLNGWQDSIILVSHLASSNTVKCGEERGTLDTSLVLWALSHSEHLLDGANSDLSHLRFQVSLLEILNRVEKRISSEVEIGLSVELGVCQEVLKSSLLDKLVLAVNTVVLKLLLGVSHMLVLHHLALVSPLVAELAVLIVSVHIVEHGELGSNEVCEVTDLNQTNVEGNEELVMPDHSTEPVVVLPAAESGDGVDRSNIESEENEASTGSCKSLVVWRHLLWTNSTE